MKKRRILKKILIFVVSVIFLFNAYINLTSNVNELKLLSTLNLSDYRNALGIIDIIIALSLWIKKTRSIGILIGTAYLGGAIASELSIGDTGLIPAVMMILMWIIQKIENYAALKKVLAQNPTI